MIDLEELAPDQLFALAGNPACICRQAVLSRLRAIAPSVAKKFDPVPVVYRATRQYGPPIPVPPPDPTETIAMLGKFPTDRLLDIVVAVSVYSRDIRAAAANLVRIRTTAGGEFARKVAVRKRNDPVFAEMMK